jgi:hypothetical protein
MLAVILCGALSERIDGKSMKNRQIRMVAAKKIENSSVFEV